MKLIKFIPLDTLFFRDGRPYNLDEPQNDVESLFPPSSITLIGAYRAATARVFGWKGGDWSSEIKELLGDGSDLASLEFSGPYLIQDNQVLFPAPLSLLRASKYNGGSPNDSQYCLLAPAEAPMSCDMGNVRLPKPRGQAAKGLKPMEGCWLNKDAMEQVLRGKLPNSNEVIEKEALWNVERRIGSKRSLKERVVVDENALYSSRHIRLANKVQLALTLKGLEKDITLQAPSPVGGESRMAWIDISNNSIELPQQPELNAQGNIINYTVIFITPGYLDEKAWLKPNGKISGLPGTIVSACTGRAQRAGGWQAKFNNTKNSSTGPQPLHPLLPAGSVLFMQCEATDEAKKVITARHGTNIGMKNNWGFGQILIGTWEENK